MRLLPVLFLVLLGAGPPAPLGWAFATSALVKVRPGVELERLSSIALELGRNECQAAQVVVDAKVPLSALEVRASALEGPGTLALSLSREGWLELAQASNDAGAKGLWPDVLIPAIDPIAHEPRRAFPFEAPGDRPTVAYVEVCAPGDAKPGLYRGTVRVSARGRVAIQVPVRVRVLRYTLPATSTLPVTFGFSGISAARAHGLDVNDPAAVLAISQRYATLALAHRLSLHGMTMASPPFKRTAGGMTLDFRAYDRELAPFMDGTALPSGARFTTTELRSPPGATTDAEKVAYWRALAAHLKARGWLSRTFYYAPDEPRPAQFEAVRHLAALVHQADPALRVLITASRQPGLADAADLWAPNLNCLFKRPGFAFCPAVAPIADYASSRARGGHLWWYQSCSSHGCGPVKGHDAAYFVGWPSYMVDAPMTLNRAMGAAAFAYGIEGELYFNTVEAYDADPWTDLWRFHGNGDGTLFYPGTPSRIGGKTSIPLASLRLQAIRDGLQDYELLSLAAKEGQGALAKRLARELVREPWEIERSPAAWAAAHHALAQALDAAAGARSAAR